jgi:hypothetical protein
MVEVSSENGEVSALEDVAVDMPEDAAAQADAMDENDYNRGKRFKRLYAILSSAQVSLHAPVVAIFEMLLCLFVSLRRPANKM